MKINTLNSPSYFKYKNLNQFKNNNVAQQNPINYSEFTSIYFNNSNINFHGKIGLFGFPLFRFHDSRNETNESINPLNKYSTSTVPYLKDVFKNEPGWFYACSGNRIHTAWKIHIYTDDNNDLEKMIYTVMPYLLENNIASKFATKELNERVLLNSDTQHGKGITIYPESIKHFRKIASDVDYIIRNNNLTKSDTNITGDNNLGTTGRLFYRYEFNSGKYKDEILNLRTSADARKYKMLYDKNRGGCRYLAPDMTILDDPFKAFNPQNGTRMNEIELSFNKFGVSRTPLEKNSLTALNKNGPWVCIGGSGNLILGRMMLNLPEMLYDKPDGLFTVGRLSDNDIVLNNSLVSRKHCEIIKCNGHIFIRDVGSRNGTNVISVSGFPGS